MMMMMTTFDGDDNGIMMMTFEGCANDDNDDLMKMMILMMLFMMTWMLLVVANMNLDLETVLKVCSRGLVHVLKMLNNEAAKDEKRRSHLSLHGNSPRFGNRKFAGSTSCL